MFSCKSRFCPTCGKKATDQWIAKQQNILPNTDWQHITFTMPGELWEIFKLNRFLLKKLSTLAAHTILKTALQQGVLPAIFTALHTFGRDLKWNTHIHLSTTLGGLTEHNTWKKIRYSKKKLMPMWRYAIIDLLRKSFDQLTLPEHLQNICPDSTYWNRWLNQHYQKQWIIHLSKPAKNHYHNVKYIGSYIKRPPLSMSRLKHYDGNKVVFEYFDHCTKTKKLMTLNSDDFMQRFIEHIPDKHFRMINYYGFLANRVRTEKLALVYRLLDQTYKACDTLKYPALLKRSFGIDPRECILCKSRMVLDHLVMGLPLTKLKDYHEEFALAKQHQIDV